MTAETNTTATATSPIMRESLANALLVATTPTNNTPNANVSVAACPMPTATSPLGSKIAGRKRNQVKNACTNCQKACKKCADERPCPRCVKYNIATSCVNSVRKERQRGIKRGPYKRKSKYAVADSPPEEKLYVGKYDSNKSKFTRIAPVNTDAAVAPVKQEPSDSVQPTPIMSNTVISTAATAASTTPATATVGSAGIDYGYPPQLSQYPQGYPLYYSMSLSMTSTPTDRPTKSSHKTDDGSHIMTVPYILPNTYPSPIVVDKEPANEGLKDGINSADTSIAATAEEMERKIEQFARLSELCSAALREKEEQQKQQQQKTFDDGLNATDKDDG